LFIFNVNLIINNEKFYFILLIKYGSSRYFFRFFGSFSKERGEPACGRAAKSRGLFLVAAGGEKCSNYFQDSAPARNCQVRLARFGGLGDQIVGGFGRKNQLAVLF